ncbi:MAG: YvrJ family protein [Caldicoprobacterales bacterium]
MLQGVANFGFPIIVSAYLLIRMENKMENLAKGNRRTVRTIERIERGLK